MGSSIPHLIRFKILDSSLPICSRRWTLWSSWNFISSLSLCRTVFELSVSEVSGINNTNSHHGGDQDLVYLLSSHQFACQALKSLNLEFGIYSSATVYILEQIEVFSITV